VTRAFVRVINVFNFPCQRSHSGQRRFEPLSNDHVEIDSLRRSRCAPVSPARSQEVISWELGGFGLPATTYLWRTTDEFGNIYFTDDNQIYKVDLNATMSTLAGTGEPGFADGPGNRAQFAYPAGVAVDRKGNVYVADTGNHRIRKIDQRGNVTTLAGSGQPGFTDGIATVAQFQFPLGLANDRDGNLFVADRSNRRVRKIDPTGKVSTLAGNGIAGLVDGFGIEAQFLSPAGIMGDHSGNLYVSDLRSPHLRKIDQAGEVTTLVQGSFGEPLPNRRLGAS
jgi:sugar lactone lactonase YvrE